MEMLAVHPAYWKRGLGGALTRSGMDLAKTDGIQQGVIATEMGKAVYSAMGFKHLEDVHLDGDGLVPQGVTVSAMIFDPNNASGNEVLVENAVDNRGAKDFDEVDEL